MGYINYLYHSKRLIGELYAKQGLFYLVLSTLTCGTEQHKSFWKFDGTKLKVYKYTGTELFNFNNLVM